MAAGDILLSWTRRTRSGGEMRDGADVLLSETSEAYEVDVYNGRTKVRTITGLTTNSVLYTVAQQTTDFGSTQSFVRWQVFQMGKYGRGFGSILDDIASLPNLLFWLRGQGQPKLLNNQLASTGPDYGPYNTPAAQATGSAQPTWLTSAVNLKPGLSFDTARYLDVTSAPAFANALTGSNPKFTAWIVGQLSSTAGRSCMLSFGGSQSGAAYNFSCNGGAHLFQRTYNGAAADPDYGLSVAIDTNPHLWTWEGDGAQIILSLDGPGVWAVSVPAQPTTFDQFRIGGRMQPFFDNGWNGKISDVLIFAGQQTAFQKATAKYYLANYYNLTVT